MNRPRQLLARWQSWPGRRWIGLACAATFALLLIDRARHLYQIKIMSLERGFIIADLALYMDMLARTDLLAGRFLPSVYFERYFNYPNFMCEHFSPTLVLFAPLVQAYPQPALLPVIQVLAFGVTAALLYHLVARVHGSPVTALGLAVLYISNQNVLFSFVSIKSGFYHDSLIPPLTMLLLYFGVRRKQYWFLGTAILLAGVKENIPFFMLACATMLFAFHRARRRHAVLLGVTALMFILANSLLPATLDCTPRHSTGAMARLLLGLENGQLQSGFPLFVLEFFRDNPLYLLSFLAPLILIASGGQFLLTYGLEMKLSGNHFLSLGTMLLVALVLGGLTFRKQRWYYARVIVMIAALVSAYYQQQSGRELMLNLVNSTRFMEGRIDHATFSEMMARIPEGATFTTTSPLQIGVAAREGFRWSGDPDARFHIFDAGYLPLKEDRAMAEAIEKWRAAERLRVIMQKGDLTLFEVVDADARAAAESPPAEP